MSWRFWLGLLPCGLFVGLLAVSNREALTVTLEPFPVEIIAPVYLHLLGATFLGFLVGALSLWLAQGGARFRARALRRAHKALEDELRALKIAPPPADAPASGGLLSRLPH